ncbi:MAG TPA: DUF1385 domain-containing protein [Polyangiaceae bacterium]|nr:DUF1385 domain-containing protein [Polyangiaceae bacterium]
MQAGNEAPGNEGRRPYIGGQALLEGVMMRSPHSFSIVCRRRSGELVVRERPIVDARQGARGWPLVRGVMTLVESLRLGSEALRFSAEIYERDLAEAEAEGAPKPKPPSALATLSWPVVALALASPDDAPGPAADEGGKGAKGAQALMIGVALLMFIAAPQGAAWLVNRVLGLGLDIRDAGFQLLTGAFKLTIVVGYLALIRRVPEIRRVFQYHGAEHKSISAYEAGEELVVANARSKTTLHPRCGTTFLVLVALVSVIIFSAVAPFLPRFGLSSGLLENVALFLLKLPFIPVIAAVTFELQRFTAKFCTTGPLRALLLPGFAVQKITTVEPDDDQLEVALASLRAALSRETEPARAPARVTESTFASYETFVQKGVFSTP